LGLVQREEEFLGVFPVRSLQGPLFPGDSMLRIEAVTPLEERIISHMGFSLAESPKVRLASSGHLASGLSRIVPRVAVN
jgi:hypothetical protein